MYPITNEVKALFEAEQRKVLRITGTDKNGAVISITDNDVIADSFQVDRYSCNGEKLEVGTAIAAQMSLTLENGGGQYNGIVFEGAELFVEVGIADWTQSSPTITYVPCGYFTPDEQPRRLSTISITGLDRMTKFDVVVDAADLTFPATVAGLVGQVCTLCGVTLAQSISGLVNAGVNVAELPTAQEEITYRNLIQWCAGVMGTNAWFDWNGQLRFSWYANATGYVSTVDNRYSSDLYEDDLTVSGIEYTNDSGIVIVEGTDDYAIDLTGNAIAGPLVATVLPPLNTALNGFTYRPFTAATVNAPYLWPMDVVTFTDKDGNNHTSVLTNVAFGLNGTTAMESKGMTYAINKLAQPKGFTREQAQLVSQAMEHVEQDIDDSLTQQEIFNRLTNNGAAQGLLLYNGQLYINASYINAGYLSADHIQGGTLTLGGQGNQNGVLRILNANGDEIGHWNNNGIAINAGAINLSKTESNKTGSIKIQQSLTNQIEIRYADETSARLMTLGGINPINIIDSNSNDQMVITERGIFLNTTGGTIFSVYQSGGEKWFIYNGDHFNINADVHLYQPLDVGSGGTGATTAANARTNLGITPVNIGAVSTSDVINVAHGGTNATTPAQARANLEITPANIGAVSKSGDIMTGNLSFAYANMLSYGEQTTRRWLLYPNGDLSSFHLATQELVNGEWTNWRGVITAHTDGSIEINQPLGVDQGGTGTRDPAQACANIGAVAKSGDTMTGPLTVPNMVVRSGSWQFYFMQDSNGAEVGHVRGDEAAHHIAFREITPGTNGAYEDYYLPNPTIQSGDAYYSILTTKSAVGVPQGGTGATDAPGARTNLGIATTVTTIRTTGITSHGNWKSDLNPNNVVIDAAYCTAGTVAVTPYCNSGGKWAFHCIDVSTGAAYGTEFDLTIRYHNIY